MSIVLALSIALSTIPQGLPIEGMATWYGTGPGEGQAAAGRPLRRAISSGWRNNLVRVCRHGYCIRVRLTDFCRCKRVIDLSDEDFAKFAPLSRGVIHVHIRGV